MPRHEFEHSVSQKDNRGKHVRRRPNLSSKMQASDNNISRPLSATGIRTTCTSSRENYDDIEALLPIPRLTFVYSSMLIVMFTLVSYWTCVHGDFVFDDSEAILNNRDVGGNISVSQIFFHDFWGTDVTSNLSHKSYRPLTTLTFKLNYYIAGGMYPWGFHFFNIAVHVAVCMLLLLVFDAFFGTLDGHCRISFQLKFPRACLFSVLFFTVHPVHTECVCGIVGRAELLSALLFSIAFLLFTETCKEGRSRLTMKMFSLLVVSALLATVAMLFKEQGITVLGLCCVYDAALVFNSLWLNRTTRTNRKLKQCAKIQAVSRLHAFKPFLCRQLFLAVFGGLMILSRFQVMGGAAPKFKPVDNPASFEESFIFRTINYNYIYSLNMWLLIFPWWLCFDWSMGCVPVITRLDDLRVLAPILMWVMFFYVSWSCLRSSWRSIFLMGVAMLVVPFLPASNIFFQVGFVVAERVLYLSSGGYCVLFVLGLAYISKNVSRKITCILAYGSLVLFTWRSLHRSGEWLNEESLFVSGEKVCPLNAKVHYNIGKVRSDANNVAEALKHYKEAIRLYPEYDQAYNNLGNLLESIGDLSDAEQAFEKALAIRPTFAASWMNLGITKSSLKKYQEAEKCYLNALRCRKKYPDAHYNLGNLYIEWKKPKKALEEYQKSLRLDPLKKNAWNNIIVLLENSGQLEKAALACKQALGLLPKYAGFHFSLGNILGKMGKFKESEGHFLEAIQLKSTDANYFGNLGVLYHKWGKKIEAEKFYRKALSLNPDNQMVQENFRKLQGKRRHR